MSDEHMKRVVSMTAEAVHKMLKELAEDGMAEHLSAPNVMLLVVSEAMDILGASMAIEVETIMDDEEIPFEDKLGCIKAIVDDTKSTIAHMTDRLPSLKIITGEEVYDAGDNVIPFPVHPTEVH
jgi:hypothetical protein